MLKNPASQTGQKGSRCKAREKSTSGGECRQYVGATPFGAEMISAEIERDYPIRLLSAGWWHMSLFQQPARMLAYYECCSTIDE